MKRINLLVIVALTLSLMFVGAKSALADGCAALGGNIVLSQCVIDGTPPGTLPNSHTGIFNLDETLRITGNGRIDASGGGITINICVAPATPSSTCDLIIETPIAATGGQI